MNNNLMEKTNNLLDELIVLLNNNLDIMKLEEIKKNINQETLDLINEYRINPSIENKKKLYNNDVLKEYITCESNINYLIMTINNKFKSVKRGKNCESNKW